MMAHYTKEANQKKLASSANSEAGTERERNTEWQTQPARKWQTEARCLTSRLNFRDTR